MFPNVHKSFHTYNLFMFSIWNLQILYCDFTRVLIVRCLMDTWLERGLMQCEQTVRISKYYMVPNKSYALT